ncbi:hypothetical protein R5R35_012518 [Gryllus longicercus]|uniref:Uncharacterized protein n=1 Tax=Gryllus longicercus TaxID=2509291 RepID=A0AAN9VLQ0_9ORTH
MEKSELLHEKENDSVTSGDQRRRYLKNLTRTELTALKKEVRAKIARSDASLTQLDKGFEDLKVCVVRMANVIEECQNLVKAERQESRDLRHILRDTTCSGSCKTNVVIPMVAGIPLKKARISLKRLGPSYSPYYTRGTSATATSTSNDSSDRPTSTSGDEDTNGSDAGPSSSRAHTRL